jgi:hypothetical protein
MEIDIIQSFESTDRRENKGRMATFSLCSRAGTLSLLPLDIRTPVF